MKRDEETGGDATRGHTIVDAMSGHEETSRGPRVIGLNVYPLKSARGIAVARLELDDFGATGDRRWLLVDADGVALTAREHHNIARIHPQFASLDDRNGAIVLSREAMPDARVEVPVHGASREVIVWGDVVPSRDAGDAAALWCSDAIGTACRLVYIDGTARRPLAPKYAGPVAFSDRAVTFTDGAPLLVLGTASLDALNGRLQASGAGAIGLDRFRANIVVETSVAHDEDTWGEIKIGSAEIGIGSPCARCVMTTIDPDTLTVSREPLRTLATYRRVDGQVMFAMNATHRGPSELRMDDEVMIVSRWRDRRH